MNRKIGGDAQVHLSIVIPAYNEEDVISLSIPVIINEVRASDRYKLSPFLFEIIVVDDGSEDQTLEELVGLRKKYPNLRIVKMFGNQGHMSALEAGLRTSNGSFVITMDADLQDPVRYIPKMLQIAEDEDVDCVQCVRTDRSSDTKLKKITAQIFYMSLKMITGVKAIPNAADFRLLTRDSVLEITKSPEVNKILRFIIPEMKLKTYQLEIVRDKRIAGKTKYPYFKMASFALDSFFGFSRRPLRAISLLGIIASVLFGSAALGAFLLWFAVGTIPGWTSLVMLILASNSLVLAALGVIGEYISKIFIQSVGRSTLRYTEL